MQFQMECIQIMEGQNTNISAIQMPVCRTDRNTFIYRLAYVCHDIKNSSVFITLTKSILTDLSQNLKIPFC